MAINIEERYSNIKGQIITSKDHEKDEIIKKSITLIEWEALDRITTEFSKYSIRKIGIIALFLAFLCLLIKDFWLILVIGVVYFVSYIFISAPAHKVKHKVTNNGIYYANQYLYLWKELKNFYFEKKNDHTILVVNTYEAFPGRLYLVLDADTKENNITKVLNEHISIVEEPEKTFIDKLLKFISVKLNI